MKRTYQQAVYHLESKNARTILSESDYDLRLAGQQQGWPLQHNRPYSIHSTTYSAVT